jgi:hypothetical protein
VIKGIFFSGPAQQPKAGQGRLILEFSRSQHRRSDSSEQGIGPSHRSLPEHTTLDREILLSPAGFFLFSLSLYFYPYFCVLILLAFAFCFYSYCVTHTTQTPMRIRTRNPSKPEAADPRFRQLGHWDRRLRALEWIKPAVLYRCPLRDSFCNSS